MSVMSLADSAGAVDVGKFGYAFFGAIVAHFLNYFFRKNPPNEPTDTANGGGTTTTGATPSA